MSESCAIVLAGGQGKRMRSDLPKPMFEVLGVPMLDWVTGACEEAGITDICVVTGFNHEVIERHIGGRFETVLQSERKGTGHAVMMAAEWLASRKDKDVLILNGDAPFIDKETILASLWQHKDQGDDVTVITAELDDPHGYGRIIRSDKGLSAIVEEKDATDEQRRIKEVNSGAYWFRAERLLSSLDKLRPNNAQGEYYLTDTIYILLSEGYKANAFTSQSPDTVLGANDRRGLLMLNDRARAMIINKLLDEGVEFASSDGVTIGRNVRIGAGAKILQGTIITGDSEIGENSVIGPNCLLDNTKVGRGSRLNCVQSHDSTVGDNVSIGPYVQLRPGTVISDGVKIGDFVEIKNSNIGANTAVAHLTYIGDSDVGSGVNFGCGVVTVNYDGKAKFRTVIGDNAFIGCNTNLVAPVTVGNAAYTGAGSTITKDVPDGALAVERSDTRIIEGFGRKRLKDRIDRNKKD
ncbi:MAG: bifunctional UDP-N-acetylglucosamine diphosphorylase/glucosamine-1-phosphate N-acetyltransferase GlmU [Oscillospiraceae bacterium]|nr:bifunctional UDP-N-acetylglucosamine diphosphorylase/glucosamine-1-phosphate N-acetyltransferase GlmU [Oscillospiraceae bacterium]